MWLAELRIEDEKPKQEVLKPGTEYTVGRGERHHFYINSKKVAKDYCSVKIGAFSDDDVGNPETRPPVQVINIREKDKAIAVCKRGEEETFYVGAGDVVEWEDGWIVQMAKKIALEIKWERSCFLMPSPRGGTVPVEACAKLGIHLVHVSHKEVTHHITSTYNATLPIAVSLVNQCKLVRSEYLTECIRLAENPEVKMVWPNLSKYRPTFAAGLDSRHKRFEVWEPSAGREYIFSGLRFLCAGERNREIDSHLRLLLERGEGAIETFDVRDPARGMKWHRALSRGQAKEGKTLVILGEQESVIAAIGEDSWKELFDEAQGFGLVFRSIKDVVLAVLDNDTKALTARCESFQKPQDVGVAPVESPLPDVVPNTIPEELTIPPTQTAAEEAPARKKLPQRRVTRPPSVAPESRPESQVAEPKPPELKPTETKSDEPDAEAPQPRRVLTRRVHTGTAAANKSASNVGPDVKPSSVTPAESSVPFVVDYSAPGKQPSSRLKRRVGNTDFGSREASAAPEDSAQEPVSKKYKSLFEESDPTKDQTASLSEMMSSAFSQSQTMSGASGSRARTDTAAAQTLDVVPEEAEITTAMSQSQTQMTDGGGRKRKARSVDDEDEEMAGVEEALAPAPSNSESRMSSNGPPPSKKKAIENVNAVEPSQPKPPPSSTQTQKNAGAAPGKPDTDDAFLKAVASTKRGKKHEDDFDREFNKLKISKPNLNDSRDGTIEEEQRQWAILEDFGDDSNIRGNFMMIIELGVDVSRRGDRERQREKEKSEWEGKPNFKKFRKKNKPSSAVPRSQRVEVVLNEQSGYGMGVEYWRGSQTQTQKTDAGEITMAQSSNSQQPVVVIDSDEEEEEPPKRGGRGKSKASARAGSVSRTTTNTKRKQQALFLDSDEEMSQVKEEEEEVEQPPVGTLESAPPSTAAKARGTRGSSRKQPVIVDDDSDDDVFKGFKGKVTATVLQELVCRRLGLEFQAMARPLSLTPANLAVSTTLLVYDWICTLDQEVVHIWSKPGPWSLGSVIFLFNRYMPFVDIFLSIHLTFGTPAPSSAECLLLMKATSWLTFTGLALSEFVLMLRTYALWERSRRVLLAFIAMFAILVIPGIIVTQMEVRSLQFGPSTDISCQLIEASNIVFVSYLLLLFCETIIAGLTLVKGYQHLRRTRSRWVVRLYKDGLFFYIYLCLLSLGNIITFIFTDVRERAVYKEYYTPSFVIVSCL
ncbi:Nbs1 [Moniliophthora roreri MCA 2997]|uniref:Nbs1 n=1 Tax=Moniliophthora roreri (strain MCA 2997) TaxID=1381753 RepID=V2WUU2_MONRO|nr:Nbs1 [Moniliophthora roreri MCA 2997]